MNTPIRSRKARLACAALLITSPWLAACGSSSGGAADGGGNYKVTAVMANVTDPYFITMECGMKNAAKKHDIALKWTGATTADVQTELNNLKTATLSKPDAIVNTPFDSAAFVAPVRQMMQQGIPYLMVDGALNEKVAWKYIVTEHKGLDKIVGDPIAQAMGGTGKIAIVADAPSNNIDKVRYVGWVKAFATTQPKVKVLKPQYVGSDTAKAASTTSALISGNPDLTAIFATNGPELTGVASAVKAAGKTGKIKLFGYAAGVPQDLALVRSGVVTGIFVQAPYLEGQKAMELLAKYLPNRKPGAVPMGREPYEYNTPLKYIDAKNIDDPATKPFYGLLSADGPTC